VEPDDPRVGLLLGSALSGPEGATCVLVGFPVDEGVLRNGGRPGAAQGPAALRRALARLTPDPTRFGAFVDLVERTWDLGDLVPGGDLAGDQETLARLLAPPLERGAIAVILGGGHETALAHFLGHAAAGRSVSVLNWDSHPDVRPLREGRGHSGSPFREILEHRCGRCTGYQVVGLNPHVVAKSHLEYLDAHSGRYQFGPGLTPARIDEIYAELRGDAMVSFDLDAIEQGAAPGVSAPAAIGLTPALWLHAAFRAGCCPAVRSIDIVELCPPLDRDDQTARLAALTVWMFWSGLAARNP
jgi:formiminoglutamase